MYQYGIGTTPIIGIRLDCRGPTYYHGLMIGDVNTLTTNSNYFMVPEIYQ